MKTIKIFLASSIELQEERKEFEAFLYQKSKLWKEERDIFLEMKNWENFIDAVSKTRLQDEYNKAIKESDIFVMLFWTKVGLYTDEEFDVARKHFTVYNKPLIYTYFKKANTISQEQESLVSFKNKLKDIGHFETVFTNTEGLLLHFNTQLDQLYSPSSNGKPLLGRREKMNKQNIVDLIDRGEVAEALEELMIHYSGKNQKLNALMDEFINPPNNYSQPQFVTRLKLFVARN